jgi:hypothetical protein
MPTDYYYLYKGDCSEFIVMPPIGRAFDDPKWHARVDSALSERFPPYKFKVTIDGPWRDETFVLIPVLRPGDGGGSRRSRKLRLIQLIDRAASSTAAWRFPRKTSRIASAACRRAFGEAPFSHRAKRAGLAGCRWLFFFWRRNTAKRVHPTQKQHSESVRAFYRFPQKLTKVGEFFGDRRVKNTAV